jgi:hypothetical protein
MDPVPLAHARVLDLDGHVLPDTLAPRHVSSMDPSTLMSREKAKKEPARHPEG